MIEWIGGGSGSGFELGHAYGGGWIGGSVKLSDGSTVQVQPIIPDIEEEEIEPIFAYVRTSESISFMKEMYAVDLGVINNASSEFVIENCSATLSLPTGLSLAATKNGNNTLRQKMDDIAGQETKTVSWVVKGDKKGEYNVSADFEGRLQPFDVPVKASFQTENSFTVGVGKGLHLYIYPEEFGYIGEDYYIQYELRNEGSETFYNLETSFNNYIDPGFDQQITVIQPDGTKEVLDGTESHVDAYVIPNVNKCQLIPVTYGKQRLQIGMFFPGDVLYGTFQTTFDGEGDPEEVRYRLIESLVTGLEETDIQVDVIPIPSHILKYNIQIKIVPTMWADPVDMTTGAFTDEIQALSVQGAFSTLALAMHYNSLNYSARGTVGYGWSHGYEAYLDFKGNAVDVHWNAANFATFVRDS